MKIQDANGLTPEQFIDSAVKAVNSLTDAPTQMHRRGAMGRKLTVLVHRFDRWAQGAGHKVTLRLECRYVDYGYAARFHRGEQAEEFAHAVGLLLESTPAPIPGDVYDRRKLCKE